MSLLSAEFSDDPNYKSFEAESVVAERVLSISQIDARSDMQALDRRLDTLLKVIKACNDDLLFDPGEQHATPEEIAVLFMRNIRDARVKCNDYTVLVQPLSSRSRLSLAVHRLQSRNDSMRVDSI